MAGAVGGLGISIAKSETQRGLGCRDERIGVLTNAVLSPYYLWR
jgi:hypothetical protein